MHPKTAGRRGFLKKGAALAGFALAPTGAILAPSSASGEPLVNAAGSLDVEDMNALDAVLYGRRSRFVTTVRALEGMSQPDSARPRPNPYRPGARTPLGDSVGIITPSSLHYTTQHFYGIPDINPTEQKLLVHGMVDRELVFTLEELKRLPFVSRIYFLECNGNRPNPNAKTVTDTHGRVACSEWTGVPLSVLLREAGIKNGAKWIIAEASDDGKHAKSVPLPKALDDVIVAYGQNGEPVRPDHGFPLRLFVPGFEGIYNVKWLRRIKVVDRPYLTFQEASRYLAPDPKTQPDSFEFGPKSVITYPSGQHQLPSHGSYVITGLAWSGGGVVRKVEVSTDGGKTYQEAEISGPALSRAFTRFCFPWRWEGEEAVLQSRCIDEKGQLQPTEAEAAKYWGYTRQQLYTVSVTRIGHSNWIQPWRVHPNGKVTNGLPPVSAVTDMHG